MLLTSSSSSHDQSVYVMDQDMTMPTMEGSFVSAVRGLVCLRMGRIVRIFNLTTRQVVELPVIRSELKGYDNVWSYFGHDPILDEYKVLVLVWETEEQRIVRSEYQVLVLGVGASWRKIQSHIPHLVYWPGVTINGVLYYAAFTDEYEWVIMSFDLSSEEFNMIEFPIRDPYEPANLMNYNGKVAVFDYLTVLNNGIVNVWVLEDADKSQWSKKKTLFIDVSQMNFFRGSRLVVGGTSRSGDVIMRSPRGCLFIYDWERNEIAQRIDIRPSLLGSFKETDCLWSTFWDDIESIMYLEI